MRVLVTGATGNVGRPLTAGLVEAGVQVRALTRDPGRARLPAAEVVQGDLTKPETVPLDGVDRMFLFPEPSTAKEIAERAKRAGVQRIVVLSSGAVTGGFDTTFHPPVERAVQESGLEWTHLRPGEFAANKLALWGPSIRAERLVRDANPDAAWFPVHERDVADVALKALLEEGHHGKAYDINGPELISLRDQVQAIADALGEQVRFEEVTPAQAREIYLKIGGFAAEAADFLLGFTDYDGNPADPAEVKDFDPSVLGPLPTAQAVTGRPPRTFAQWARDHVEDFR
ncbi:SDR family oxidoreductase [Bailinhaonella thermotolerans]|uniref:NAD-dependent epimerase/dehydratase family protein n=1 Tax=Bailinhaonella thermotolerans TaxID=1070861 RepID=A0A3A4B199_9ACTN|nr:NAD(P)H-binding protein [Bailinhaonella thermotolerans]RJL31807.1 NAD-dependent epimerase/dehydratase family protein [Bailinhaonella thermotolerans]